VRTRDGALLVTRVQLPGKKPIEAGALLNARLLAEGDQLG
jgi:methionyl-tRNA formyltransferase